MRPLSTSLGTKKLSPEELDAAIREMNEEMESLFGAPAGDTPNTDSFEMGSSSRGEVSEEAVLAALTKNTPPAAAPPAAAPREIPASVSGARAALLGKIDACASDMGAESDVEHSTRLAACIHECARAIAALDTVK